MDKLLAKVEELRFSVREYCLIGIVLFLIGLLLGIIISPKGERMVGSNNGNNNGNNNTGCLTEDEGCSNE